jgi:ABC-type Fe3+-citrate transport system substrate-binding protein
MSVKLWYLGEVGSEKEMKKLLLTHEKVEGELKNSINAVRKGLYQFEFDNSNSWINSKRVRYENEVFAPLQIKTTTADDWIEDFYSNIYMNEVFQEVTEVVLIDNTKPVKPPQKPPQRTEESETKATETGLKR